MRRVDKEIGRDEALEILNKCQEGIFSTVGEDGYPYGVPVNHVYDNGVIYFHCANLGHKLNNISFSSKVSFCGVLDAKVVPDKFTTKYKSVIVFGKATLADGAEKNKALELVIEKFSPDSLKKGAQYINAKEHQTSVVKIVIERVSGKMAE